VRSAATSYLIVFKHDCERSATIALGSVVGGLFLITCIYRESLSRIALLHCAASPSLFDSMRVTRQRRYIRCGGVW